MSILSRVRVASALIFPTWTQGAASGAAYRFVKFDIKLDRRLADGKTPAIDYSVRRFIEAIQHKPDLLAHLSGMDWLVPVPRRAPFPPGENPLWPPLRIAQALHDDFGVGKRIEPCLRRTDRQEERMPRRHFDTIEVVGDLLPPSKVLLVADVVTTGSTHLGGASRIRAHYPDADVHAFALARTVQGIELERTQDMLAPLIEKISDIPADNRSSRGPL